MVVSCNATRLVSQIVFRKQADHGVPWQEVRAVLQADHDSLAEAPLRVGGPKPLARSLVEVPAGKGEEMALRLSVRQWRFGRLRR